MNAGSDSHDQIGTLSNQDWQQETLGARKEEEFSRNMVQQSKLSKSSINFNSHANKLSNHDMLMNENKLEKNE